MNSGSVVKIEFDPTADPDQEGHAGENYGLKNTIYVGPHALASGDAVEYSNRRGNSIGGSSGVGLNGPLDGDTYYIITVPDIPDTEFDETQLIQLSETESGAFEAFYKWEELLADGVFSSDEKTQINEAAGGLIGRIILPLSDNVLGVKTALNSKTFKPDAIDSAKDEIKLSNPPLQLSLDPSSSSILSSTFELGQKVRYNAPEGGVAIGGLEDGKVYYVLASTTEDNLQGDLRLVDKQVIKLSETENKARAGVAIDIDGSQGSLGDHTLSAYHVLDSGLTTGIGIRAELDSSVTTASSSGDDGDDSLPVQVFEGLNTFTLKNTNSIAKKYIAKLLEGFDMFGKAGKLPTSRLNVAGTVAFNLIDNTVLATVGDSAVLQSGEDLEVIAKILMEPQLLAESSTEPGEGKDLSEDANNNYAGRLQEIRLEEVRKGVDENATNAASAAIVIGLYNNIANSTVKSGARLDATDALRVISEVSYPFLTRPDEFVPTTAGEFLDQIQTEGAGFFLDYLDGTFGIQSKLFNSWAQSSANGRKTALRDLSIL